ARRPRSVSPTAQRDCPPLQQDRLSEPSACPACSFSAPPCSRLARRAASAPAVQVARSAVQRARTASSVPARRSACPPAVQRAYRRDRVAAGRAARGRALSYARPPRRAPAGRVVSLAAEAIAELAGFPEAARIKRLNLDEE